MGVSMEGILGRSRIVPVISAADAEEGLLVATALREGGFRIVEMTLRSPGSLEALAAAATVSGLCVGAGTVLRSDQLHESAYAGAQFVVSPGLSPAVVRSCQELGVPVLPGIATATELQQAIDLGIETVKFFPAVIAGGPPAIRALSAPFPNIRFVPTGGITQATAGDYLALSAVAAVGGSWMVPPALVAARDIRSLIQLAKQATQLEMSL